MKTFGRLAISVFTLLVIALAGWVYAHSGGLNSQGCHGGSRPYHCHRSPSEMVRTADGRNRLRCDLGSRSVECVGRSTASVGLAQAAPVPAEVHTTLSMAEAYQRIVVAVEGQSYSQGLNVMYLDRLTVRFVDSGGYALLRFEGTNHDLYERIRRAVFL